MKFDEEGGCRVELHGVFGFCGDNVWRWGGEVEGTVVVDGAGSLILLLIVGGWWWWCCEILLRGVVV
jgi:hypothetical protein